MNLFDGLLDGLFIGPCPGGRIGGGTFGGAVFACPMSGINAVPILANADPMSGAGVGLGTVFIFLPISLFLPSNRLVNF